MDSKSGLISWSPPFSGNSRITRYVLSVHQSSCCLSSSATTTSEKRFNVSVSGTETSWLLSDLQPASNYSLSLTAVNALGSSDDSTLVSFVTDDEGESGSHLYYLQRVHPLSFASPVHLFDINF